MSRSELSSELLSKLAEEVRIRVADYKEAERVRDIIYRHRLQFQPVTYFVGIPMEAGRLGKVYRVEFLEHLQIRRLVVLTNKFKSPRIERFVDFAAIWGNTWTRISSTTRVGLRATNDGRLPWRTLLLRKT